MVEIVIRVRIWCIYMYPHFDLNSLISNVFKELNRMTGDWIYSWNENDGKQKSPKYKSVIMDD